MSTGTRVRESAAHPWWFIAPAFAILAVFFVTPTLFSFIYAFTDWSSFKSQINPVGFDNFVQLFQSGSLLADLRTTLIYAILVALFQNLFGLGYIFQALLKPAGALNGILGFFVGHPVTVAWLNNSVWTIVIVALIQAWKWMGLSMLIYLAGLKTISSDVLEAGRIDGAGWWATLTYIRFPLIAPAVTFNVATALLGSMNGFDVVQATTQGGPGGATEILNIFIFRTFGQGLFAQATTMSLILLIMISIVAVPVIRTLRRREEVL
jgi:raffinose/stachyose/melibiose transport system permease protein